MLKIRASQLAGLTDVITVAIASRVFFGFILLMSVVQGMWYALSFRPFIFDEPRHIQFIDMYTHTLNPLISVQTQNLDVLGQVAREPSYLYYYAMSFPLRFFHLITDSQQAHIILLRFVSIGIFVVSLLLLKKLFDEIGLSKAISNLVLFIFIMLPVTGTIIGSVTYDTAVLPLIFLMLLCTTRVLRSKQINVRLVLFFYVIACVASVIKYTSLPIAVTCTFIIFHHYGRYYKTDFKKLFKHCQNQLTTQRPIINIILGLILVAATFVAIERPIKNMVSYHNISPSCARTLPPVEAESRCIKNYTYKRDVEFKKDKPADFAAVDQTRYFLTTWVPGMLYTSEQQYPGASAVRFSRHFHNMIFLAGLALILLALREALRRNKLLHVLLWTTIAYSFSVFLSNYDGYARLGKPVAINARYLLPVLPLFIGILLFSCSILFKRNGHKLVLVSLLIYILTLTQGGGIISYIMNGNNNIYWPHNVVIRANDTAKLVLSKIVLQ